MSRRVSRTRRLMLVLFLNLALITTQVAVGVAALDVHPSGCS